MKRHAEIGTTQLRPTSLEGYPWVNGPPEKPCRRIVKLLTIIAWVLNLFALRSNNSFETATFRRGKTISGIPGSSRLCNLNRKPCANIALRISNSGLVFLARIPAIILLRFAAVTMSVIRLNLLRVIGFQF